MGIIEQLRLDRDLKKAEKRREIFTDRSSDRHVPNPFIGFSEGDFCAKGKRGYFTDAGKKQQMIDRSKTTEFIDISDPALFMDGTFTPTFDFNILFETNPFPNGMFIYLSEDSYGIETKHIMGTCAEIRMINNEFRIDHYSFHQSPIDQIGSKSLELHHTFYAKPDGKFIHKYNSYTDTKWGPVESKEDEKELQQDTLDLAIAYNNKIHKFILFILVCRALEKNLASELLPIEGNEIIYRGDIQKILYIKETPRIREVAESLRTVGYIPHRYHSVRGHKCTSSTTGKTWFRKGHHRGNKEIGEVEKIYKVAPAT